MAVFFRGTLLLQDDDAKLDAPARRFHTDRDLNVGFPAEERDPRWVGSPGISAIAGAKTEPSAKHTMQRVCAGSFGNYSDWGLAG
jgi:hypothetical protein